MAAYMSPGCVPDCCRSCQHYDSDSKDEYSPNVAFCLRNQIFPTKKKSCKAHLPWPKPTEAQHHD